MRLLVYFSIPILILCSCDDKSTNSIRLKIDDSTFAEGNISPDTVFNGLIKFYNIEGKVISECEYENGMLNGTRKDFYSNGRLSYECNFIDNSPNGVCKFYNVKGELISTREYFYGLRVGGSVNMSDGRIEQYTFYSLDYQPLFQLNYDSKQRKVITELHDGFFFLRKGDFSVLENDTFVKGKKEVFLYLPNPPNYNFKYSLVYLNKNNQIISRIRKLESDKPWIEFLIDSYPISNGVKLGIELNLKDSIDGGKITMLKVIDQNN